ncbi:MAG: tRNA lysidine(34) synthetase TilS [Pseudobdellovibrionaceae bacterium]
MSKEVSPASSLLRGALDNFFKKMAQMPDRVAVGVSGGADSLALARALHDFYPDIDLHILTVDHGLRTESAAEAATVGEWVASWGGTRTHNAILGGAMPYGGTKLQEGARHYRYSLMLDYCTAKSVPMLLTAHHGDDQLETFLIRLCAGSTPSGLKSMQPLSQLSENLTLGRPLLSLKHADCVAFCHEKAMKWVEDPSNENADFQRVRMRKMAHFLEGEGFDIARLTTLTERLADLYELLNEAVNAARVDLTHKNTSKRIVYRLSGFKALNRRVAVVLLEEALEALGLPKNYGPRLHKVEDIVDDLRKSRMATARTLNGCRIAPNVKADTLEISPEKPQK